MSIEFGSKMGIMNPDQTTYDYLKGRECVPKDFDAAVADWKRLVSDEMPSMTRLSVWMFQNWLLW